jgi:hypothetical protein
MYSSFNIREDVDCHQEEKHKVGQKMDPCFNIKEDIDLPSRKNALREVLEPCILSIIEKHIRIWGFTFHMTVKITERSRN